jgi:hypothetical protein
VTEPNEFEEFLARRGTPQADRNQDHRCADRARARRNRSPDPEDDLLLEPNVVPNALGHFLSHIAARITRTL